MKLSRTLPALVVALDSTSASSNRATSRQTGGRKSAATNKFVRNARRVQQNNYGYTNGGNYGGNYGGNNGGYYGGDAQGGQGDEKEAWYLANYSLKMIACLQGEQSINYEQGDTESSTVIFRLCPHDTCGADNSTSLGCEEGYGDFAVGINTFAQAYVESVKDNYNNGMQYYSYDYGEFDIEEYTRECSLFEEGGEGEGNNQNNYNNYGSSYYAYIGAACTVDGTDIRIASFSDPYCTTESDVSFESTHNGMVLPYSNGGLVPNTCMSCLSMNDNYEYEVNEMCQQTYEDANYRCEENMQSYNSYYGPDTRGCEYLESKVPAASSSSWSSLSTTSATEISKSGSDFFQNQSESVKLAEEYAALLIASALLGAAIVVCCVQKTVTKKVAKKKAAKKEGVQNIRKSSVTESIKSAATLIKVTASGAAAKIAQRNSCTQLQGDYNNVDEDEKGFYVPPTAGSDENSC